MLRVCLLARFLLSNARLVVSGVQRFAILAVGCKAGIVWLWRYQIPSQYTPAGSATPEAFTLVNATNIFFNCCLMHCVMMSSALPIAAVHVRVESTRCV